jgi:acyl-CoA synthetase (NDP forming)
MYALSEAAHQLRNLAAAEKKKYGKEYYKPFPATEITNKEGYEQECVHDSVVLMCKVRHNSPKIPNFAEFLR